MPGIYKAWLADNTVGPASRFVPKPTVPYRLPIPVTGNPGGTIVANSYNALITSLPLLNPINLDEFGFQPQLNFLVWTNVLPDGTPTDNLTCLECNSTSGGGRAGFLVAADDNWTDAGSFPCSAGVKHLYCFEQPQEPPSDPIVIIPTMGQWGMIIALIILGFFAVIALRRRTEL